MRCILLFLFLSLFPVAAIATPSVRPVSEMPYYTLGYGQNGWEDRGPDVEKWLITGVRIGGGSGTMVYYDRSGNWMYVISAGHMFGNSNGGDSVRLEVFYHNHVKLDEPTEYTAEVLGSVWNRDTHDVALLRFHPDWDNPIVSPIVKENYIPHGELHSIGCDGRDEIAHYLVTFDSTATSNGEEEIITIGNAARAGRSGGGLLNKEGKFLGICSRSEYAHSTPGYRDAHSFFTSFKQIYEFLRKRNYEFVLRGNSLQSLPIEDQNNPQGTYPEDYITVPLNSGI